MIINKIIKLMSLESRYKHIKDPNCNQNYLNFIKKNQHLM
jgi:hypothetical protein